MGTPLPAGVVGGPGFSEIPTMRIELLIDGMVAVHAKHAVFQALAAVEGITRADVELGRVELDVTAEPDEAALREAIAAAGCSVREDRRLPTSVPML